MDYETELDIDSRAHAVVDNAINMLVACGMTLDRRETKEATLSGPGLRSTNQNPILGVTSLRLIERDHPNSRIIIHADLGGVRWLGKFMIRLPLLMTLGFLALYAAFEFAGPQLGLPVVPPIARWTTLGAIVFSAMPWFFIRPSAIRKLTQRTEQAIENLIRSADRQASCEPPEPVTVD
ncbi:MAG: hypothetical protein AAFX06_03845 [Planctomycetota bacterium]